MSWGKWIAIIGIVVALLHLALHHAHAQTQVRLCYALPGSPFCQNVDATHQLPVQQGSTTTATGVAHQVRLCYAIPNSPFCQVVDAAHPLPVQ